MTPEADGRNVIEFVHAGYRLPNGTRLLDDVHLEVRQGEVLILLGRSGAGKTTTLKLINRMLEPSEGEVRVEGRSTVEWDAIALRRRIGYVIQETGLFPHFTIEKNIAVVPRLEGWEEQRVKARVGELLELVGLPAGEFRGRYPHELSGGQRQRVGLARALAADPPILLMDEPFGELDPVTRADVRDEFLSLEKRIRKTVVMVTHDVPGAIMLGTRIAVFDGGRVKGVYSPREFLRSEEPEIAAYRKEIRAPADLET
ncbi:MAG TPA: ATP-binding cassette domain-containing protein [Verrucomicrobiae bacterium]|nr:ATP-binding cassette domain-containing protein [Verrucomicrobiae bacterium]